MKCWGSCNATSPQAFISPTIHIAKAVCVIQNARTCYYMCSEFIHSTTKSSRFIHTQIHARRTCQWWPMFYPWHSNKIYWKWKTHTGLAQIHAHTNCIYYTYQIATEMVVVVVVVLTRGSDRPSNRPNRPVFSVAFKCLQVSGNVPFYGYGRAQTE